MPRIKLFDEDKAVEKAMDLFWQKGFASTSLADLTLHLGISKGSFYDTFQGKRPLFLRAFNNYRMANLGTLSAILNSESDVKVGIRKLLEFTVEGIVSDENRKGCFAANTCSEMGGGDDEIRDILIEHDRMLHQSISNYLKKGELREGLDTDQLSRVLITFLTGINQEVKIKNDKAHFIKSIDQLMRLLD